jgi:glycine/D-amino acid oxidase-like deaminating enzyme
MPHRPVNWTETKAFQLGALLSLEQEVNALEAWTGLSCGYKRCGRVMPIHNEKKLQEHEVWKAAAEANWPKVSDTGQPIVWRLLGELPFPEWASPSPQAIAYSFDTLSARINPRELLVCLLHALGPTVKIHEHCPVVSVSDQGAVTLQDGTRLSPGSTILSSGYETFDLLEPIVGSAVGWGVKGQSVLLQPKRPPPSGIPIIYSGGNYITAHQNGMVSVGSTTEKTFADDLPTKDAADLLHSQAIQLCPALQDAAVVERWAGIRPRAVGRQPLVGPLPGSNDTIVATGGFKITLGIAHLMADAAVAYVTGSKAHLPEGFKVDHHLALISGDKK